jgi:7-dehydrocholesterol reductase
MVEMPQLLVHDLAGTSFNKWNTSIYVKKTPHLEGVSSGSARLRADAQSDVSWGRSPKPTWSASISSLGIMVLSPILVVFTWITLSQYNGSLSHSILSLCSGNPWDFMLRNSPTPSFQAIEIYAIWILTQAALYNYLPAKLSTGQLTPAGYLLRYYTNGFTAWLLTHVVFGLAVLFQTIDPAWIAKNWSGLIVASNIYGMLLSMFVYVKAFLAPTHAEDRKFSGT